MDGMNCPANDDLEIPKEGFDSSSLCGAVPWT